MVVPLEKDLQTKLHLLDCFHTNDQDPIAEIKTEIKIQVLQWHENGDLPIFAFHFLADRHPTSICAFARKLPNMRLRILSF